MKEIAEEIKRVLDTQDLIEDTPVFNKNGFIGVKISEDNFHDISLSKEKYKMCFIDGGNTEIISANNMSLQLIRVAAVCFEGVKKTKVQKKEFYTLVTFEKNSYLARSIPEGPELRFELNDESLKDGKSIAKISRIGGFIRRIAELDLAREMVSKNDFIILDGSLEEKFSYEHKYLSDLYNRAQDTGAIVAGLCKTNSLLLKNGGSISACLARKRKGAWYYHPVAKIDCDEFNSDICFARLNNRGEHVFRVDIHNGSLNSLFAALSSNSNDAVFPGYPYGLLEVDRLARISNKEQDYLKTRLKVELGNKWPELKYLQNTLNAHDILNKIG